MGSGSYWAASEQSVLNLVIFISLFFFTFSSLLIIFRLFAFAFPMGCSLIFELFHFFFPSPISYSLFPCLIRDSYLVTTSLEGILAGNRLTPRINLSAERTDGGWLGVFGEYWFGGMGRCKGVKRGDWNKAGDSEEGPNAPSAHAHFYFSFVQHTRRESQQPPPAGEAGEGDLRPWVRASTAYAFVSATAISFSCQDFQP